MRAVLFDLDETLFDRSSCMLATAITMSRELGIDEQLFVDTFLQSDRENEDKIKFANQILKRFPKIEISAQDFVYFRDKTGIGCDELFPNVINTLKKIKKMNYKLGLVSNASRKNYQLSKVERLGLNAFMDTVVISDNKMKKPDRNIFDTALSELSVSPSHTFFCR